MPPRTDHELNAEFLTKLMEEAAPEDWVPVKAVAGELESFSIGIDTALKQSLPVFASPLRRYRGARG